MQPGSLVRVRGIGIPIADHDVPRFDEAPNLLDVHGSVGEEEEGFGERADFVLVGPTNSLSKPMLSRLARPCHRFASISERLEDTAADRRLARSVDALEGHESRAHGSRQGARGGLKGPGRVVGEDANERFYSVRRLRVACHGSGGRIPDVVEVQAGHSEGLARRGPGCALSEMPRPDRAAP